MPFNSDMIKHIFSVPLCIYFNCLHPHSLMLEVGHSGGEVKALHVPAFLFCILLVFHTTESLFFMSLLKHTVSCLFLCSFWKTKTKQILSFSQKLCKHDQQLISRDTWLWVSSQQTPQSSAQERHKRSAEVNSLRRLVLVVHLNFCHLLKSLYPCNFEVQPEEGFEKACNLPRHDQAED